MRGKLNLSAALVLVLSLNLSVFAQTKPSDLRVGFHSAGAVQFLHHSNTNTTTWLPTISRGFQSAVGNLTFDLDLADGINVYFDLYLSSSHHEGTVYDREGYVYVDHLPDESDLKFMNGLFKYLDIKAGHMEVDFGNNQLVRSDNADVQRNPLIGNYIIDPNTVTPAVEFIVKPKPPVYGVFGISNGTVTGDFKNGRGTALYGKVGVDKDETMKLAFSLWNVDHSKNPTGYPNNGSFSELFSGNRSGERYYGVVGGGGNAGQVTPGKGQKETAWQADGSYSADNLNLSALYGWVRDSDTNGSASGTPKDQWQYYGVEAKYNLLKSVYIAGRYNAALAGMLSDMSSDGKVQRMQVGFGVWVVPGFLFKGEYVSQTAKKFTVTDLKYNPKFSGVLFEMSISY